MAGMPRRSPTEKLAAWVVTGPFGHLYGTLADITTLWSRWAFSRVRAKLQRG